MVDAMKYSGGYQGPTIQETAPTTWEEHRNLWHYRDVIAATKTLKPSPKTEPPVRYDFPQPELSTLIKETPDVVVWLRARMETSASKTGDDDMVSSSGDARKAPFRLAYMAAADREVQALAYWAAFYNVVTKFPMRYDGDRNSVCRHVIGVSGDDLRGVHDLSRRLAHVLTVAPIEDGLLSDPRFGLWTVRKNHYALFEGLAEKFTLEETPAVVEEGLF